MALLPWFEAPFAHLLNLQEQGRMAHAWLVSGPAGVGKQRFAEQFAGWQFCSQPGPQGACGSCQDCHLYQRGTHPDWLLLQPEKRLITVGQVRELIDFAHNTSQRGTKVLVITPAEAMNLNAANALLKILEEPPRNTLLILVSHQSGQLLATLRSRCQELILELPPQAQAIAWLTAQGAVDAPRLLAKAKGAPLKALALRDNEVLECHDAVLEQLLRLLRGEISAIQAAKTCEKFAIQTSIEFLLNGCRDLLGPLQAGLPLQDQDFAPLLEQLQTVAPPAILSLAVHGYQGQALAAYKVALAPNNANVLLILEALFGDWVRMRERLRKGKP